MDSRQSRISSSAHLFYRTLLFFFGIILTSCAGGGTEGTGGVTIEGSLLSREGVPLAQVEVIVAETGDSTITNDFGDFSIVLSEPVEGDLTLLFEGSDIETQVAIPEPTSSTVQLALEFVFLRFSL